MTKPESSCFSDVSQRQCNKFDSGFSIYSSNCGTAVGVRVPFIVRWPGQLPQGKVVDVPIMNIDIFPTIASLVGAPLPNKKIDGMNIWPILTGSTTVNPHKAYFFYFGHNELQAVRYQNWKLILPHTYKTLGAKQGGHDGLPVPYDHRKVEQPQLFNLRQDPEENHDVAAEHPDIVAIIQSLAEQMRLDLGDALTGVEGSGRRPIGRVD